jgi:phosphoribosylglycinamide formyltransferase-1
MFKLGVLISGDGSNLQSIIDSCESGFIPDTQVSVVISNKETAFGLERATKHHIPSFFVNPKEFDTMTDYYTKISQILTGHSIDLVCLAGFLLKIEPSLFTVFKNRVVNIHPALLPKFGGKGMYGHHVHEAVLQSGETESGPTVHYVDEIYDHGKIILQSKVPVLPDDTPDTLAARVLEQEHKIYPEAIKMIRGRF